MAALLLKGRYQMRPTAKVIEKLKQNYTISKVSKQNKERKKIYEFESHKNLSSLNNLRYIKNGYNIYFLTNWSFNCYRLSIDLIAIIYLKNSYISTSIQIKCIRKEYFYYKHI